MSSFSLKQALKILPLLLMTLAGSGLLQAAPDGPAILAGVRNLVQSQQASLAGRLRTGPAVVAFTLEQANGTSVYRFSQPDQVVRVTFSDNTSAITGVNDPRLPVRESVLTYDDLALRFLYWTDIRVLGTEKIRSLPCWHLRLAPPNRSFAYGVVHLWVNQQSGAFLRAEAYDWEGKKVRRFEVISTQTVDGRMILKKMRIQDLQSEAQAITYLEIDPLPARP